MSFHMKTLLIIFTAMSLSTVIYAQDKEMPLWPNGAPGALGKEMRDIPTITPFPSAAKNNSGSAIVICPGGGYGGLASHEGSTYAQFLQQHGINAFVLKYRLGSAGYRHPIMLGDAARAIRTVRTNAKKWNVDPEKIGIMGSSAGGHLASTMITHFDKGNPNASDPTNKDMVFNRQKFEQQNGKAKLLPCKPSKIEPTSCTSNPWSMWPTSVA